MVEGFARHTLTHEIAMSATPGGDDGARATAGYNPSSPSVRRILREMRELADAANDDEPFIAEACEDDIFEWHFALLGPPGTPFEGGIYHGRIIMPPEYPFKPPSFVLLTANGRFETGTKICLSITPHHPKQWQPSWSVRTALTAIRAFFPTPAEGAVGSLDWSDDVRRELAVASTAQDGVTFTHGNERRRAVSERVHRRMVERAAKVMARESQGSSTSGVVSTSAAAGVAAALAAAAPMVDAQEREEGTDGVDAEREDQASASTSAAVEPEQPREDEENESEQEEREGEPYVRPPGLLSAGRTREEFLREMERDPRVVPLVPWPEDARAAPHVESDAERAERVAMRAEELKKTKRQLDTTAMALAAAIAAIIIKRIVVNGVVSALQ